jgi:hypothetical protein
VNDRFEAHNGHSLQSTTTTVHAPLQTFASFEREVRRGWKADLRLNGRGSPWRWSFVRHPRPTQTDIDRFRPECCERWALKVCVNGAGVDVCQ